MTTGPAVKWMLRAALIPAAIVAYVGVAGLTGFCPTCKGVVDGVLGRHEPLVRPAGVATSVAGLKGYTFEGEPVELAAHTGKPMIIEVWATWCGPCHKQREIIKEMGDELTNRATLVGLSVDTDPREVADFLARKPSGMVELMAPTETLAAFGGVNAVPTLVFVDATGEIRGVQAGVHSAGELRARLSEISSN